ncbi:MAG: FMN-binding protein [Spirochaetaceae bacterium]|jgi:electron transport complex protein RnfG|nr:FMN-binding protein [Spirochaetaceae bacterium]
MKDMFKLGLVLALYASVACGGLAVVNGFTAPLIAAEKEKEVNQALAVIFEGAEFESAPGFKAAKESGIQLESMYLAKKSGQVAGAVMQVTGPTYDKATLLVGVDMERKIAKVRFLSISDTPGFGQRALEPAFYNQFAGKSVDDPFEAKADVDAISGATITSRGVSAILKTAVKTEAEYLAVNNGGKK